MKATEILKLLEAGYTKDEIIAMNEEIDTEEPTETSVDTNDASSVAVDLTPFNEALTEMKDTFNGFMNELTAMNILNSKIENTEKTGDDIIANIINPYDVNK